MGESGPSEEAIALFTNVFGYAPDPEALHAGECWQAERIDAALRRAKAEGLELAARELCMYCNDPGNWAPMSNSGYHQCNAPGPNMTRCYATKIHALRREIDARAAQIEEGEDLK